MTGLKVGLAQRGDYPVDIQLVPELEIPDEREREDIANGRFHGTNNFMVRKATPGPGLVLVPERLADCYKDWFVPGETIGKLSKSTFQRKAGPGGPTSRLCNLLSARGLTRSVQRFITTGLRECLIRATFETLAHRFEKGITMELHHRSEQVARPHFNDARALFIECLGFTEFVATDHMAILHQQGSGIDIQLICSDASHPQRTKHRSHVG